MKILSSAVGAFGAAFINSIRELGRVALFGVSASAMIFIPPFKFRRVIENVYFIGVKSVFVVSLTGLFTGMVLGLQMYYTLTKFGSEGLLGAAVALSLVRELGPVLASLMVAGRAGSSIAANLGTMRISEQIDALDTMDINPVKFLISPRIAASIICMPLLTALFNVVGIFGGYLTGVMMLGVNSGIFVSSMESSVDMADVVCSLEKPLVFGFVIALISCYRGFHCDRLQSGVKGSEGVSLATTSSVVIASVLILVLDYVLTSFLL